MIARARQSTPIIVIDRPCAPTVVINPPVNIYFVIIDRVKRAVNNNNDAPGESRLVILSEIFRRNITMLHDSIFE